LPAAKGEAVNADAGRFRFDDSLLNDHRVAAQAIEFGHYQDIAALHALQQFAEQYALLDRWTAGDGLAELC
jgi:hypothetical protein